MSSRWQSGSSGNNPPDYRSIELPDAGEKPRWSGITYRDAPGPCNASDTRATRGLLKEGDYYKWDN